MDKYHYSDGSTSSECDDSKQLHRTGGPAIEWDDGTKEWWVNGKPQRVRTLDVRYEK